MCNGSGFVTSQTICDCKKLLEPSTGDWKPGEKVLIEAEILGGNEVDGKMLVIIDGLSQFVPLSSIHPMPGKDGGK